MYTVHHFTFKIFHWFHKCKLMGFLLQVTVLHALLKIQIQTVLCHVLDINKRIVIQKFESMQSYMLFVLAFHLSYQKITSNTVELSIPITVRKSLKNDYMYKNKSSKCIAFSFRFLHSRWGRAGAVAEGDFLCSGHVRHERCVCYGFYCEG